MFETLIVLGVIVLSFALRSTGYRITRKLGALGILGATYLAFYFFTGSIVAGAGGILLWFLLPWIELLTRVRRLRLPLAKSLERQAPPGASRFPDLTEITDEVEEEGFLRVRGRHRLGLGGDESVLSAILSRGVARAGFDLPYRARRHRLGLPFRDDSSSSW